MTNVKVNGGWVGRVVYGKGTIGPSSAAVVHFMYVGGVKGANRRS
jgi:hypothetical protein